MGAEIDVIDRALHIIDPVMELATSRPHDVLDVGKSEGHEEKPRLVDVAVVLVDDGDLDLGALNRGDAIGWRSMFRLFRHRGSPHVSSSISVNAIFGPPGRAKGPSLIARDSPTTGQSRHAVPATLLTWGFIVNTSCPGSWIAHVAAME